MNKEFIQVTKGVLPLSILALLAIALIAEQSGSGWSIDDRVTAHPLVAGSRQPLDIDLVVSMPDQLDLHALIPKAAISADILTNRKLVDRR